jgi:hypothetical protein
MGAGAHIAMIVVLVFIIGFFVLVVLPDPAPISNGGNLPPDPSLPAYIKAVQAASTTFAGTTAALVTQVGGLAAVVGTTFVAFDWSQGVRAVQPWEYRPGVEASIKSAQDTLKTFAQKAAAFDKTVQGWTASTNPYTIMQEKPSSKGPYVLKYEVMNSMADFLRAEGQLTSLVSAWTAAYEAASKGNSCSHSSDCTIGQACSDGRCTAVMNGTMQGAVNALSSAAGTLKAYGTLNSSPWQKQADDMYGQYEALYNHLSGL